MPEKDSTAPCPCCGEPVDAPAAYNNGECPECGSSISEMRKAAAKKRGAV